MQDGQKVFENLTIFSGNLTISRGKFDYLHRKTMTIFVRKFDSFCKKIRAIFAEKYNFCRKIIKNLKKIHITPQGIEPRPPGANN